MIRIYSSSQIWRENYLFVSWIHPSIFCRVCGSGLVWDSILEHASRDHCVSTAVELRRWSDWTKRCQIQMRGGNKKLILTWWRHKSSSARLYHTEITRITDALYSNELWTKSYVGLKLLSLFILGISHKWSITAGKSFWTGCELRTDTSRI